jgi:hypothetical protein
MHPVHCNWTAKQLCSVTQTNECTACCFTEAAAAAGYAAAHTTLSVVAPTGHGLKQLQAAQPEVLLFPEVEVLLFPEGPLLPPLLLLPLLPPLAVVPALFPPLAVVPALLPPLLLG